MIKHDVGVWLGIAGGVLCILNLIVYISKIAFWGDYIVLSLDLGIVILIIAGVVLARKSVTVGGYVMFLTSLIWVVNYPLLFVFHRGWLCFITTMLTCTLAPWPILSFIGGILILSEAREKDSVMLRSGKRENL